MRRVIEINPEHASAMNYLGYTFAEMGTNLDEAEALIHKALALRPDDGYITDSLGWVYYKKGFYDLAIGEFSDSLTKLSENPVVNYHLGLAYYKKGENDKAREQLEKALSLQADFPGADEARKVLADL